MEFQNKADFEFYNNISEPIIAINSKNEIIYCNGSALDFFGIHHLEIIENININNVIKFNTLNNGIFNQNEFINNNKPDKIRIKVDVNYCSNIEIDLVIKYIKVCGDKGVLLLFKDIVNTNGYFRVVSSDEEKIYKEESADLKYIMIDKERKTEYKDNNEVVLNLDLYKTIFAVSTTGIVIEKENEISYFNKSAADIIGNYPDNMILGKSLFEVVKIEELKYKDTFLKNQHLKYDPSFSVIERKVTRKDGTVVYCEITPMCFEENDKICSIFLLRDISRRVKVEEAVVNNRDNYATLLKFLPFGVAIYTNNKFDVINKALTNILGINSVSEFDSLTIADIIHEDYQHLVNEMYFDAYFRKKTTEFKEIKVKRQDGTLLDVEISTLGIDFDHGRSIVFLAHEITERKKAELNKVQLEQAIKYDRLKTEFISNMSHELKTPLNIILSTVQVLQHNYKDYKDEQLRNYLDLMKSNSYRLLRLINNLIDVTRIDVGNLKMNFGNYDIVAIVEDITMAAVEYVESKGMSLIFDTNIEEKIVGIDKENIERVILNLLSNAVKFSKDKGTIVVDIHDLDDKVKISVKDNGIGIPINMQEKIFDKFVQSESLFTRSHEGSGIGLSLVKSIVENHGGRIFVNSVVGRGSEFVVELPSIMSKNKFCSSELYNASKNNSERIKIEFSDIYK
ncbi:PAS domain-containing sensor histidine kinase [Clostridium sp.]|uniref:sensor histidine kinase n=1 Tax=Clostridium sp. TaxID=1506 RepID=UPI003217FB02